MPKPVLQAMVLADHVYQDRASGKFVIAGTFGTIYFGPRNLVTPEQPEKSGEQKVVTGVIGRAGSPFLYFALAEIHGRVSLDLKYVDLSDASILIEAQIELTSNDPVAVSEYMMQLPELPAHKAGNYSLDLLHDDEILGSWRVAVRKIPDPSGGDTNVDSITN